MVEDVTPKQVFEALRDDPAAVLCDVRTVAEWQSVGIPAPARPALLIEWQMAPDMRPNPKFLSALQEAAAPGSKIYFICRSGVRSQAAAEAARAAGYEHVYNVADGFEGPPDATGRRGRIAGWQADDLPWTRP